LSKYVFHILQGQFSDVTYTTSSISIINPIKNNICREWMTRKSVMTKSTCFNCIIRESKRVRYIHMFQLIRRDTTPRGPGCNYYLGIQFGQLEHRYQNWIFLTSKRPKVHLIFFTINSIINHFALSQNLCLEAVDRQYIIKGTTSSKRAKTVLDASS